MPTKHRMAHYFNGDNEKLFWFTVSKCHYFNKIRITLILLFIQGGEDSIRQRITLYQ
jgi:hypothetical protein